MSAYFFWAVMADTTLDHGFIVFDVILQAFYRRAPFLVWAQAC